MLILRIWNGVIDHFPIRRSEWINSCVMIGWGVVVLLDNRPLTGAWHILGQLMPEIFWALMLMTVGAIRLLALLVNGTFPKTWYGRVSPHVRVGMSLLSSLVWLQLVIATIGSPVLTTGLVAYLGYLVSDALNTLSSAAEARELDKGRRNVAARTIDPRELNPDQLLGDRAGDRSSSRIRQEEFDDADSSEAYGRHSGGRQFSRPRQIR